MPETAYPAVFGVGQGEFNKLNDIKPININYATAVRTNGDNLNLSVSADGNVNWKNFNTVTPLNLNVDIPQVGDGTAQVEFSVNELRLAFAYQRYLEALARSGSRYTELLLGLFGIKSSDASSSVPSILAVIVYLSMLLK